MAAMAAIVEAQRQERRVGNQLRLARTTSISKQSPPLGPTSPTSAWNPYET